MALARTRRDRGVDYWPGFVDALSTLLLGIIFLLSIFAVVQFYLSQEVTGKDTALQRLNAQIAQLNDLLALEKNNRSSLEEQIASFRSNLAATESERDRLKGLADGAGNAAAAQGRANELASKLDLEKQSVARALAQVELLNQQIAALRRQLGALEAALESSEKRDRESQSRIAEAVRGSRVGVIELTNCPNPVQPREIECTRPGGVLPTHAGFEVPDEVEVIWQVPRAFDGAHATIEVDRGAHGDDGARDMRRPMVRPQSRERTTVSVKTYPATGTCRTSGGHGHSLKARRWPPSE